MNYILFIQIGILEDLVYFFEKGRPVGCDSQMI